MAFWQQPEYFNNIGSSGNKTCFVIVEEAAAYSMFDTRRGMRLSTDGEHFLWVNNTPRPLFWGYFDQRYY